MRAPDVAERIANAQAVAIGLRESASYCTPVQEPLRVRLVQAAQAIDGLVEVLEMSHTAAQLNHDTIVGRRA